MGEIPQPSQSDNEGTVCLFKFDRMARYDDGMLGRRLIDVEMEVGFKLRYLITYLVYFHVISVPFSSFACRRRHPLDITNSIYVEHRCFCSGAKHHDDSVLRIFTKFTHESLSICCFFFTKIQDPG